MKAPLLIQVDLLGGADEPVRSRWLPLLARLAQDDRPVLLLAERPDRWAPTRSRVDRAFQRQSEIEAEVRRAGGALDGVIYVDLGLFSRRRQHERIVADLANRYDAQLGDLALIARPGKLAEVVTPFVGASELVEDDTAFERALEAELS